MILIKVLVPLALLFSLTGCFEEKKEDWVVKVNKTAISAEDVQSALLTFGPQVQQAPPEQQAQLVLSKLIESEMLYQEALKEKLNQQADYQKVIASLEAQLDFQKKQQLVSLYLKQKVDDVISVTEQDIQAVYEANKNVEQRSVAHILVETEKEANQIMAKIKKGVKFDSLVKSKSIDKATAQNKGIIPGFFRKVDLNQSFATGIFSIKRVGLTSGPVKSEAGYHIFKLLRTKNLGDQSFDDVKESLRNQLYLGKRSNQVSELLKSIKEEYQVTQNDSYFNPEENKTTNQQSTEG